MGLIMQKLKILLDENPEISLWAILIEMLHLTEPSNCFKFTIYDHIVRLFHPSQLCSGVFEI